MDVIELAEGAFLALILVKFLSYLDVKYKTVLMSRRKANSLVSTAPSKKPVKFDEVINPENAVKPAKVEIKSASIRKNVQQLEETKSELIKVQVPVPIAVKSPSKREKILEDLCSYYEDLVVRF